MRASKKRLRRRGRACGGAFVPCGADKNAGRKKGGGVLTGEVKTRRRRENGEGERETKRGGGGVDGGRNAHADKTQP